MKSLPAASSIEHIDQYYYNSRKVHFKCLQNTVSMQVSSTTLNIIVTDRERNTLIAILDQTPDPTVRIRRMNSAWFLTVKGLSLDEGTLEFEIDLEKNEALPLLKHSMSCLKKTRHLILEEGYLWEVDVFHGALEGLVLAEIEDREYAVFPPKSKPAWVGHDVSKDFRYKNVNLSNASSDTIVALLHVQRMDSSHSF